MAGKKAVLGKKVPPFKFTATGEGVAQLSQLKGQKVVLYFYPKDSTPGCSQEGEDFKAQYKKFQKLGVEIFGISRDSLKSHGKFKDKYQFPFDLISDPEEGFARCLM